MVEQSKNDTQRENPRRPGMFECGGPGGPGRPQGSRNAASLLLDKLAEGDGEATVKQVIEAAKAGDMRAARSSWLGSGRSKRDDLCLSSSP